MNQKFLLALILVGILAALYIPNPLRLQDSDLSETEESVSISSSVIEASQKNKETSQKKKEVSQETKREYFDLNLSLSDEQCMYHQKADSLNQRYKRTKGKEGLDDERYTMVYKYYYIVEDKDFDWRGHVRKYPKETVIENNQFSYSLRYYSFVVCTNVKR